jgi:hypothetical protein
MHMQSNGASDNSSSQCRLPRLGASGLIAICGLGWSGFATQAALGASAVDVAAMSPAAKVVHPFEAIRLGKDYVASHPGTDFMVGSGDSMLPLYKDHTVVITQRIVMSNLRSGMTVAYMGDSGRPVAHVLVKKTLGGWVTKGVGNAKCDSSLVTRDNLIGVVVKAFEPTGSMMVALLEEARMRSSVASMP